MMEFNNRLFAAIRETDRAIWEQELQERLGVPHERVISGSTVDTAHDLRNVLRKCRFFLLEDLDAKDEALFLMKTEQTSVPFICAICDAHYEDGEEWFIMPDGASVCSETCGYKHLNNKSCKRSTGSPRAAFWNQKSAEKFASDPANIHYHGDVAHLCARCGLWHLSKLEWLASAEVIN
jgi:hypothetical protein